MAVSFITQLIVYGWYLMIRFRFEDPGFVAHWVEACGDLDPRFVAAEQG